MNLILYCFLAVSSSLPEKTDSVISPVNLDEVVVTADAPDKLKTPQMGMQKLSQLQIKNVPTVFGEADVVKALQLQPGVSAGTEGFAGMYVRGGNNDENLFVFEGNPIYQLNHLGGLFSPFNVEIIDELDFYKSAFPARYGGRLSSVVDIKMKDGDTCQYHGAASIGLLSGNINVGGPIVKGKNSFNVALRRSWLELISMPALAIINSANSDDGKKTIGGYSFADFNLKMSHWFRPDSKLSLMLYYGSDGLKLGEENFQNVDGEDLTTNKDLNRLRWGNFVASLNWSSRIDRSMLFNVNASFTRYFSTIRQSVEEYEVGENAEHKVSEYVCKKSDNAISDLGINMSLLYMPNESHSLRFGVGYVHHWFTPENTSVETLSAKSITEDLCVKANEFSLFVEDEFDVSERLAFNAGLRFSLFENNGKVHTSWEPRLSANCRLSDIFSLKMSYSRMSQYVQQVSNSYISLPTDFWMPVSEKFSPLISDQLSLGAYYRLLNNYTFSVEGYYKWSKNLLEYAEGYELMPAETKWDEKLTSGSGTAYGLDFSVEKNFGRFTGFVGYGLLWSNRKFPELNDGKEFPSKYDNRHKVNLQLNYKINSNIDINCGWTFMSGNRVTLSFENYESMDDTGFPSIVAPTYPFDSEWGMEYYASKNNFRLPAYHRLDLGLTIRQPMKNGRMGIWNISVYNAYCNMNPIVVQRNNQFQTSSGERMQPRFRTLSIFPIIPSVSYTYKF